MSKAGFAEVFLALALAGSLSAATGEVCFAEFTAELRENDIWLGVLCKGSCSGAVNIRSTSCTVLHDQLLSLL